jgi:hypothetical protein
MEWTDVLQQHRVRNRANNPPKEQRLLDAARQQISSTGTGSDMEDENENDKNGDNEGDACGDDSESAGKLDGNPKVLKYYSSAGAWVTAIGKAKEMFRRFTMLYNLFPLRDSHLQDAARILSKAVADLKEEDPTLMFDQSRFFDFNSFTISSLSTVFHQNRDMNIVVSCII